MVVRISDKTQNYSKVTKLLVKPLFFMRNYYIKLFYYSFILLIQHKSA